MLSHAKVTSSFNGEHEHAERVRHVDELGLHVEDAIERLGIFRDVIVQTKPQDSHTGLRRMAKHSRCRAPMSDVAKRASRGMYTRVPKKPMHLRWAAFDYVARSVSRSVLCRSATGISVISKLVHARTAQCFLVR